MQTLVFHLTKHSPFISSLSQQGGQQSDSATGGSIHCPAQGHFRQAFIIFSQTCGFREFHH